MLEFFKWIKDIIIWILAVILGGIICITVSFFIPLIIIPIALYMIGVTAIDKIKSIFGGK